MNKIVRKEQFSEKVFLFEIEAPLIANSRKAGNFVIVRVGQKGERMPLTIAGADKNKGTITFSDESGTESSHFSYDAGNNTLTLYGSEGYYLVFKQQYK